MHASELLPEWLRFAEGLYLILYATLVIVLMVFCPSGLLGLRRKRRKGVSHCCIDQEKTR